MSSTLPPTRRHSLPWRTLCGTSLMAVSVLLAAAICGSAAPPVMIESPVHRCAGCADGSCRPNVRNFGYYAPQWRSWPGASRGSGYRRPKPRVALPNSEVPTKLDETSSEPSTRAEDQTTDDVLSGAAEAMRDLGGLNTDVGAESLPPSGPSSIVPSVPEGDSPTNDSPFRDAPELPSSDDLFAPSSSGQDLPTPPTNVPPTRAADPAPQDDLFAPPSTPASQPATPPVEAAPASRFDDDLDQLLSPEPASDDVLDFGMQLQPPPTQRYANPLAARVIKNRTLKPRSKDEVVLPRQRVITVPQTTVRGPELETSRDGSLGSFSSADLLSPGLRAQLAVTEAPVSRAKSPIQQVGFHQPVDRQTARRSADSPSIGLPGLLPETTNRLAPSNRPVELRATPMSDTGLPAPPAAALQSNRPFPAPQAQSALASPQAPVLLSPPPQTTAQHAVPAAASSTSGWQAVGATRQPNLQPVQNSVAAPPAAGPAARLARASSSLMDAAAVSPNASSTAPLTHSPSHDAWANVEAMENNPLRARLQAAQRAAAAPAGQFATRQPANAAAEEPRLEPVAVTERPQPLPQQATRAAEQRRDGQPLPLVEAPKPAADAGRAYAAAERFNNGRGQRSLRDTLRKNPLR